MHNTFLRILIIMLFSFVFLPYQWLKSAGLVGTMVLYSLLILVLVTFVIERRGEFLLLLGFLLQTLAFIYLQIYYPNRFYATEDPAFLFLNQSFNYLIVASVMVGVVYAIRKHLEKTHLDLYKLSVTDELTGVHNRRFLYESLAHIINQSSRTDMIFSILFIDINRFKAINDNMGHRAGDAVLVELGRIISRNLRNYDVGGRYGGDEFMILLPMTSITEAGFMAKRIEEQFHESIRTSMNIELSISCGVTEGQGKSLDAIIKEADSKMYSNKKKSRMTDDA